MHHAALPSVSRPAGALRAATDTGRLRLLFDSPNPRTSNQPDSVTVDPGGRLFMAEDGDGEDVDGGDDWIRTLTPSGGNADLARIIRDPRPALRGSRGLPAARPGRRERSGGPVFTPDGRYLVVTVQYPGITCVVSGPWDTSN